MAKTDGVPLFVEELTKMVLESGLLQEQDERYVLTGPLPPLAIPATLHDSLMARLDRLGDGEGRGATRGDAGARVCLWLLQAVSPLGRGDVAAGAGTSWWKRSSCTSGACRRRPPTCSSMP